MEKFSNDAIAWVSNPTALVDSIIVHISQFSLVYEWSYLVTVSNPTALVDPILVHTQSLV